MRRLSLAARWRRFRHKWLNRYCFCGELKERGDQWCDVCRGCTFEEMARRCGNSWRR